MSLKGFSDVYDCNLTDNCLRYGCSYFLVCSFFFFGLDYFASVSNLNGWMMVKRQIDWPRPQGERPTHRAGHWTQSWPLASTSGQKYWLKASQVSRSHCTAQGTMGELPKCIHCSFCQLKSRFTVGLNGPYPVQRQKHDYYWNRNVKISY